MPDLATLIARLGPGAGPAVALVAEFIRRYGRGEGVGLFSGVDRYRRLADRLEKAAGSASSLPALWSILARRLQVPLGPRSQDAALLEVISASGGDAAHEEEILKTLRDHAQIIIIIARRLVELDRAQASQEDI